MQAQAEKFTPIIQKPTLDWRIAAAIALTVITWASAFAGIRAGLDSYSAEGVALLRYLTASALLVAYALWKRTPLPALRDWPALAGLGFAGITLYNVALNLGETQIPAGTASLIVAAAPIFVALLASYFYKEHMTVMSWVGIAVSVAGVVIISVDFREGIVLTPSALLVLLAALSQAVYTASQKNLLKKYSPIQLVSYAVWFGTFMLLIFLPRLWQELPKATTTSTLAVVYMGIFPGVIGYASWSYVLSKLPASRAGTFLYLVPAVAIFIAWLWLGEAPAIAAIAGGALVVAGVILVNTQRHRAQKKA
jgi:drug/metabolite transporter (DMT)-like permease